jgi:hypothetical protein
LLRVAEVPHDIDAMRVTKRRGELGQKRKQRPPAPESEVFSHPTQRLSSTQHERMNFTRSAPSHKRDQVGLS